MESGPARDDHGRRPLSERERDELLDLSLVGIWSTLTPEGRIHSVPIHFLRRDGELRVLTEEHSVKCRNARRSGRATLCVATSFEGSDRRFVTAEGPVRVEQPVSLGDVIALAKRYEGAYPEYSDLDCYANSVILVLEADRWIAWSDAD